MTQEEGAMDSKAKELIEFWRLTAKGQSVVRVDEPDLNATVSINGKSMTLGQFWAAFKVGADEAFNLVGEKIDPEPDSKGQYTFPPDSNGRHTFQSISKSLEILLSDR